MNCLPVKWLSKGYLVLSLINNKKIWEWAMNISSNWINKLSFKGFVMLIEINWVDFFLFVIWAKIKRETSGTVRFFFSFFCKHDSDQKYVSLLYIYLIWLIILIMLRNYFILQGVSLELFWSMDLCTQKFTQQFTESIAF